MSRVDPNVSTAAACSAGGSDRVRIADDLKQRFQDRLTRAHDRSRQTPVDRSHSGTQALARREGPPTRHTDTTGSPAEASRSDETERTATEGGEAACAMVNAPARREDGGSGQSQQDRGMQALEAERAAPLALDVAMVLAQSGLTASAADAQASRSAGDAQALVQWLMDHLPLGDPTDRSVTLNFPSAAVPVERIVLSRVDGVISLAITARAEGQDRVRDALRTLEERLRSRGLKVGAVRLG